MVLLNVCFVGIALSSADAPRVEASLADRYSAIFTRLNLSKEAFYEPILTYEKTRDLWQMMPEDGSLDNPQVWFLVRSIIADFFADKPELLGHLSPEEQCVVRVELMMYLVLNRGIVPDGDMTSPLRSTFGLKLFASAAVDCPECHKRGCSIVVSPCEHIVCMPCVFNRQSLGDMTCPKCKESIGVVPVFE